MQVHFYAHMKSRKWIHMLIYVCIHKYGCKKHKYVCRSIDFTVSYQFSMIYVTTTAYSITLV